MKRNIQKIRAYTRLHKELLDAHHFTYDLHMRPGLATAKFVVMGINPGEPDYVFKKRGPTEETSDYDFHDEVGRSRSSCNWYRNAEYFCGTTQVVFTECFFWSSRNLKQFETRFGSLEKSPHLEFCTSMNLKLIEYYQPTAIIFPGLVYTERVAALYSLKYRSTFPADNGDRLVERYFDGVRPWMFTKHWSGSRGFSKDQREIVRNQISSGGTNGSAGKGAL